MKTHKFITNFNYIWLVFSILVKLFSKHFLFFPRHAPGTKHRIESEKFQQMILHGNLGSEDIYTCDCSYEQTVQRMPIQTVPQTQHLFKLTSMSLLTKRTKSSFLRNREKKKNIFLSFSLFFRLGHDRETNKAFKIK